MRASERVPLDRYRTTRLEQVLDAPEGRFHALPESGMDSPKLRMRERNRLEIAPPVQALFAAGEGDAGHAVGRRDSHRHGIEALDV